MELTGERRMKTFERSTGIGEFARYPDEVRTLVALTGKTIG
jgi:hypothetical protein